jgi:cbb3-type cytochrome oxidase subunit 3
VISYALLGAGAVFLGLGYYWYTQKVKDEERAAALRVQLTSYEKYRSMVSLVVGALLFLGGAFYLFSTFKKEKAEKAKLSNAPPVHWRQPPSQPPPVMMQSNFSDSSSSSG